MKVGRLGKTLLSTLVSLLLFLGLAEVMIRVYTRYFTFYDVEMTRYANEIKRPSGNPRIGHVHAPNATARLMNVSVSTNADGLRDRDYPVERSEKRRIAFLGDSLTFGWGVEKEDTFEERLERELNRRRPTEIINFGTGNYNTEQQVNLFFDKGAKYDPDQVVIFYFINDAEPTPTRSGWEFLGRARIATFFWSRVKALRANLLSSESYLEIYSGRYGDDRPGWIATRKAFEEIVTFCSDNSIELKVVLLPELHNPADYPFEKEHSKVLGVLRELGVESMDLAPLFRGETQPQRLWVSPDDAHPNAIGHEMIARHSLEFIDGDDVD